jgi:hypothetical protein
MHTYLVTHFSIIPRAGHQVCSIVCIPDGYQIRAFDIANCITAGPEWLNFDHTHEGQLGLFYETA